MDIVTKWDVEERDGEMAEHGETDSTTTCTGLVMALHSQSTSDLFDKRKSNESIHTSKNSIFRILRQYYKHTYIHCDPLPVEFLVFAIRNEKGDTHNESL
mmetsp:Transcript_36154/g.87436  ORF Transcript_36154/g.87436 Transcript_36154/m.87436 type:complete len:100 (+) Transcript_36154:1277-1576(+)